MSTEPQPDFGVVFQQANLMPWRTVFWPMFCFRWRSCGAATSAAKLASAKNCSRSSDSRGFEQSYPAQLSGGMQQRVALCRALIHKPKLLLMDEPFGALDELTRMEMQDLLLDIRAKTGATVLFVTHSISEAVYSRTSSWSSASGRPSSPTTSRSICHIRVRRKCAIPRSSPSSSTAPAARLGSRDELRALAARDVSARRDRRSSWSSGRPIRRFSA